MASTVMQFLSPELTLSLRASESVQPGEVHVWPLALAGTEICRQQFAALLTPAELERAGRYYFERDRQGFVFSRGQMKHLLGLYCGVEGGAIELVTGEMGKPALAPHQSFADRISFNFTHSAGRALLAVSDGRALGVDLECHDRKTDVLALAARYFFGSEFDAIMGAPEAQRGAMFFRFWTAKEAVIKAQGSGLSAPLNRFRVELPAAEEAARVESLDSSHIDEEWFVRALPCEAGWSGAVVAKTGGWRVRVRGPSPNP